MNKNLPPGVELAPRVKARIADNRTITTPNSRSVEVKAGSTHDGPLVATDTGLYCETKLKGVITRGINWRILFVLWSQVTGYSITDKQTMSIHGGSGYTKESTELVLHTAATQFAWELPHTSTVVRRMIGRHLATIDARQARTAEPAIPEVTCVFCRTTAKDDGTGRCSYCGAPVAA